MLTIIRKHKIIFTLFFVTTILSAYLLFVRKNNQNQTVNNLPKQATYNNIRPGDTSKTELIKKLGDPVKENETGSVLEFRSPDPRNHQVILKNNQVQIIKEIIPYQSKTTITDIQNEYGKPDHTLYGPLYAAGFYLMVNTYNGVAYIGQPGSGLLLEVWYFSPTDIDSFIREYALEYSKSPPPPSQ